MTGPLTFECHVHFHRRGKGSHKELQAGQEPEPPPTPLGRVPRIARLMALAIRFEQLIREGVIGNYSELARLGHVSHARISQILILLHLAPDLQEQLLFLPRTERGRDPIHLRQLQPIAAAPEWRKQRRMWAALTNRCPTPGLPGGDFPPPERFG
jgi:hypothetical protein